MRMSFYGGWWQGGPQPARSRFGRLIDWLVAKLPLWACRIIAGVRLWPYRVVCFVVGHQRCGNDCPRCGEAWPWRVRRSHD